MDKSFEENIKELEKIVLELESGDVELDQAIDKYTKAMNLAKECHKELVSAEKQIAKVVKDNGDIEDFEIE